MDTKDITKGKVFLMGDLIEDEHDNQIARLQGVFNLEEERANGLLIWEAFNVANETGLSPTQMRDRIKELEGLLPKVKSLILYLTAHPDNEKYSECEDRISDLLEIETALNNKQK